MVTRPADFADVRERVREGRYRLLHESAKKRVLLVERGGGAAPVVVKHYKRPGPIGRVKALFRRSYAQRSIEAAERLERAGTAIARPLALLVPGRGGGGESFLVLEAVTDALEMDRYVLRAFADVRDRPTRAKKLAFVDRVADEIRGFHERGIFQADLKTCNILVRERAAPALAPTSEGGRPLGLGFDLVHVDLDDFVFFEGPVPEAERRYNLAQLNSSTARLIARSDRVRFYLRYRGIERLRPEDRPAIAAVQAISRKRKRAYFGFDGPVVEEFDSWEGRSAAP